MFADLDGPRGGGEVAGQHSHGRRFTGAIGSEKSDDFALSDGEADLVDRDMAGESFAEFADFDHETEKS